MAFWPLCQTADSVFPALRLITDHLQKVSDQPFPGIGKNALRVKLHAFHRELLVAQAHDGAGSVFLGGPGAHFQLLRKILLFHDQRVIPGRCHRSRQSAEDSFAIMRDFAGFAVHQVRRAHHLAAECLADGLVPQANAEYGNFAREVADQIDADAGILRRARAG
jgi:hypothetical protein